MAKKRGGLDPATEAVREAWALLRSHPLFAPVMGYVTLVRDERDTMVSPNALAVVTEQGRLHAHYTARRTPEEWTYVFAHLACHLGFGHRKDVDPFAKAAQCVEVARFLAALKLGTVPPEHAATLPPGKEAQLARTWREQGQVPMELLALSVGGTQGCVQLSRTKVFGKTPDYPRLFASGLSNAATAAVDVAGGARSSLLGARNNGPKKAWELALSWFVSSYPLLGAMASGLTLVADAELCRAWDIRIAAVSAEAGEIYVNPLAQHSSGEWKFILAHELLHAALRHSARSHGRDPYLFNIATDYQINGWLVELGVGTMPQGLLYDPELTGLSSEEIYDRLAVDLRRVRKLMTLRGTQGAGEFQGDILGRGLGASKHDGVRPDEFYRRALTAGLELHRASGRGLVPLGLAQEIKALDVPPLSWDARLARWFEEFVPRNEPERTFARPSRRQGGSPDIPRPGKRFDPELAWKATFGVVLDTSGSMPTPLLAKALGAISSYAAARNVPSVRVVFCDAVAYDAGYLSPEALIGKVRVLGRGGTQLQPGVDLLERAPDFPATGPVLIITDGECDTLRVKREHAYLLPRGKKLPFEPKGPVFHVE